MSEKKRNFESYKNLYRRMANAILVLSATGLFYPVWMNYLNDLMDREFLGKGNILILLTYAVVFYVLLQLWGGSKLGYQRRVNLIISQILASVLTNIVLSVQITLMIGSIWVMGRIAEIMLSVIVADCLLCILFSFVFTRIYAALFPARQLLLVNGERTNFLREKVLTRDDKYNIGEEISYQEPWEKLVEKMGMYDAVLLNDIPTDMKNEILKYCFANSIRVYYTPKIPDIIGKGTEEINLFDSPLFLCKNIGLTFEQRLVKRIMDILISLLGIILTSPIMLVTALCIKIDDRGPVFFKQKRCTKEGKEFWIYKFRSMVVDAEADGMAQPARDDDVRITKVGKVIRAVRIDELPQLINILKGEMSLVGPRPERVEHIEKYSEEIPEFTYRLKVKGGLTGYAQVYGRYNTTAYDKLKMDLMYIVNYSLLLDIQILFETVKILFQKESTEGFSEEQIEDMHGEIKEAEFAGCEGQDRR